MNPHYDDRQAFRPRPPADLAARIVAHATAQPQRRSWPARLARALEDWRYGWQLKLAGVALCGMAGVFAGHLAALGDADLALAAQAFGEVMHTEEM